MRLSSGVSSSVCLLPVEEVLRDLNARRAALLWPLTVSAGGRIPPLLALLQPCISRVTCFLFDCPMRIYFSEGVHQPSGWLLFGLERASSGNVKLIVSSVAPAGLL